MQMGYASPTEGYMYVVMKISMPEDFLLRTISRKEVVPFLFIVQPGTLITLAFS